MKERIKNALALLPFILVFLFFIALTFFLYWNSLDNFFFPIDDVIYLTIGKNFAWNNIFFPDYGYFWPAKKPYLAFLVNSFGSWAMPYHLMSLVLHSVNSFLVFCLFLLISKRKLLSFFASLAFSAFYAHADTIIWFAAQGHLFMAFFFLISAILFIKFLESNKATYYIFSLLFFLIAITIKENAILLPAILFLIEAFFYRKNLQNPIMALKKYLPFATVILLVLSARVFFGQRLETIPSIAAFPFLTPINLVFRKVAADFFHSIIIAFFSFGVGPSLWILQNRALPVFQFYAILFSGLFLLFVYFIAKRNKPIAFWFIWFAVSIVPILVFQDIALRYFYIASIGSSFILVYFSSSLLKRIIGFFSFGNRAFYLSASAIALIFIVVSAASIWDFEKKADFTETIFKSVVRDTNFYYSAIPDKNFLFIMCIEPEHQFSNFGEPAKNELVVGNSLEIFGVGLRVSQESFDENKLRLAILEKEYAILWFDTGQMRTIKVDNLVLPESIDGCQVRKLERG